MNTMSEFMDIGNMTLPEIEKVILGNFTKAVDSLLENSEKLERLYNTYDKGIEQLANISKDTENTLEKSIMTKESI